MHLTVVSSTKTKNENFCNKLQNKEAIKVATEFGEVIQERQSTFYLFTDKQNETGKSADLDLSKFDIIEKSYTIVEGDNAGEEISLKYLYPRKPLA